MNRRAMVFDVEAIGIHGEGFSYGYVVIDLATGELEEARRVGCDPARARGSMNRFMWVMENVPHYVWAESIPRGLREFDAPRAVRDDFWASWSRLRGPRGGEVDLWADVGWPVEARFLAQCVEDGRDRERDYTGPYPLLDVSTVLSVYPHLKLQDPWGSDGKVKTASSACMRPDGRTEPFGGGILAQLTIHDPLCDAYVSARQLYRAVAAGRPVFSPETREQAERRLNETREQAERRLNAHVHTDTCRPLGHALDLPTGWSCGL